MRSGEMSNVRDVAAYILEKIGTMSPWKLQKLIYYGQAWALVWGDAPLFNEPIEAWQNGPIVRELYKLHRGLFELHPGDIDGNPNVLDENHKDTIDNVLDYYSKKPHQWLIDLCWTEKPWTEARHGVPYMSPSENIISLESMTQYYGNLTHMEDPWRDIHHSSIPLPAKDSE